jgi:hypothetical protein
MMAEAENAVGLGGVGGGERALSSHYSRKQYLIKIIIELDTTDR